jgi:hypothetical protein
MKTRFFDIYGVRWDVAGDDELAGWIAEDFSFFEKNAEALNGSVQLSFRIVRGVSSVPVSPRFPWFRTRMCTAWGWFGERVCDYGDGTRVRSRFVDGVREFELTLGASRDLAYEALYGAVLSAVGEELDRRGYHRVHALGIEVQGVSALVLLASGGGKSAIAALLCSNLGSNPDVKLFSDESPLLHQGRMYPFPVRGALLPEVAQALGVSSSPARLFRRKHYAAKQLHAFDPARIAEPARPAVILVGTKRRFRSLSSAVAAFAVLMDCCVIGRGLAQMTEYMLRGDSLAVLPALACKRFIACLSVLRTARTGWMEISDDARQNSDVLLRIIRSSIS